MNRRSFAQSLALAAGAVGLAQTGRAAEEEGKGVEQPTVAGKKPKPDQAPEGNPPADPDAGEPVPANIDDFEQLAKAALPKAVYEYIATGSSDEVTLRENVAAFRRIKLLPPLMKGVSKVDLTTTALGTPLALPVLLAPVAGQALYHPAGGLAAARAAQAAGTIYGMSSSLGHSVEEVAAASAGPKWFQLYVPKDRAVTKSLVQRVEKAGFEAIIVTVDLGESKDADKRNRFALPKPMLVKHLRDIGFTQINDRMSYSDILAFNAQAWDLTLSWKFFDWLRETTKLPLIIKGVLRPDDAKMATKIGVDAIVVSNHGGRRLDGMPSTIEMLAGVVGAIDGKTEVYLDSGVRRGTDVLKALALGARGVLIGRPYIWGLASQGEQGVRAVLEHFRVELETAMIACGCANLAEIEPTLLMA